VGHIEVQRWHSAFGLPSGVYRRGSHQEDAHPRSMSTFEVDEILENTWEANGPSSHRDRPRRPGVRLPSSSQSANMSGDRGCQGEVAVPSQNSQRGNSIGPAPKSPNDWASIKPIVAHPFGGVRDDKDPLPNFASAPGDFVACCQSGRQGLQHHSSGWSEGAWRHKHQRRMLQLLLLQ